MPYFAFVSMQGSFFSMPSPILVPKYDNNRTISLEKLPPGGLSGYGRIFIYNNLDELVFLYSDGKKDAIRYNIKEDNHFKIKSSKSLDSRGIDPISIRVGQYIWVIVHFHVLTQVSELTNSQNLRLFFCVCIFFCGDLNS